MGIFGQRRIPGQGQGVYESVRRKEGLRVEAEASAVQFECACDSHPGLGQGFVIFKPSEGILALSWCSAREQMNFGEGGRHALQAVA